MVLGDERYQPASKHLEVATGLDLPELSVQVAVGVDFREYTSTMELPETVSVRASRKRYRQIG